MPGLLNDPKTPHLSNLYQYLFDIYIKAFAVVKAYCF